LAGLFKEPSDEQWLAGLQIFEIQELKSQMKHIIDQKEEER
jgi:hypothetical protein